MSERTGGAMRSILAAPAVGLTDQELLGRYVTGDEVAFATLVRRHSGMVLGVCRRVLPTVQDAEDACQATFLVLARQSAKTRWQASVANWLYTTSRAARRRTAREVRPARPTPSALEEMTARELLVAVDEELDRLPPIYRETLVLCHLEGLARDEAAVRLGVPLATVKMRLERGRKRLADALTKRGIVLGAALLAASATSPAGASPPALIESVLAGVSGSPSPTAAALAHGVTMTGLLTRTKLLAVAGLVAVGFGLVGMAAEPPKSGDKMDKPKAEVKGEPKKSEAKERTITGTVTFNGKPVEGASVNIPVPNPKEEFGYQVRELAKTDKEGKFTATLDQQQSLNTQVAVAKKGFAPDWVHLEDLVAKPVVFKLVADDVPVKGRVTDLEGKPVAKATVRVRSISEPDYTKMWEQWANSPDAALRHEDRKKHLFTKLGHVGTVETDADGWFELTGIGRGRMLELTFEGDGIATSGCRVVLDPKFDPNTIAQPKKRRPGESAGPTLYGATFTHSAHPSQRVSGTITDAKTGKPVAGVRVLGYGEGPHRGNRPRPSRGRTASTC
jgi:RNA polymerase sigma factor (sigma-70 family)